MTFLLYFILWWTHLTSLKIKFTIILILHILVDSPLSRFLVTIIGLVYRLDLLVLVVHHQVHLVQALRQD